VRVDSTNEDNKRNQTSKEKICKKERWKNHVASKNGNQQQQSLTAWHHNRYRTMDQSEKDWTHQLFTLLVSIRTIGFI